MTMEKLKNLKGVQQLAGRVAALSRFISRMGEKALPFYQLLRKADKFEWTRSQRRIRKPQAAPLHLARFGHAKRARAPAAVHSSHTSGGQHSTRGRTTRRRQDPRVPTPNLLPQ